MSLVRENVYVALWNLILTAPFASVFNDLGRLLKHIEDVSAAQMPAMYQLQQSETWVRKGKGIPPIRTLNAAWVFYINNAAGSGAVPATMMNTIMDYIDGLFNPASHAVQTLGGLVEHVYIAEGEVRFYEGLLQDKSPVVIPVRILVP